MNRRSFMQNGTAMALGMPWFYLNLKKQSDQPVVPITGGSRQHWFGYYDKWQIDPTGRYALGMEVDLVFRSPQPDDEIGIGLIDLENGSGWTQIGTSRAWGWQQGCMLQWIPGSTEEVIWNDREGDRFISRIYNIRTGEQKILPLPIYTLSPDGTYALSADFNRIQDLRPGYGYAGIPDPYVNERAPDEIGIYKLDLRNLQFELIISIAEVAGIPHFGQSIANNWHYFNHLLVSPDSERFIFLHRWRAAPLDPVTKKGPGFVTRMFTANKNGQDLYMLDPSGYTSHFIWKDSNHICAWTKPEGKKEAFYLFKDKTDEISIVGENDMPVNGHNTYVPNTNQEWILNDTYPSKEDRLQTLYLYHVPTRRKVVLGRFFEPEKFTGEWRCDLHPRCDQQGKRVFFDSTHEGGKRQMYMIDIGGVV